MIKQKIDQEDQDPDEINLIPASKPKEMAARTKPVNVYSVDSIKRTVMNLKHELETKFWNGLQSQSGSNWAIDTIKNIFVKTHTPYT